MDFHDRPIAWSPQTPRLSPPFVSRRQAWKAANPDVVVPPLMEGVPRTYYSMNETGYEARAERLEKEAEELTERANKKRAEAAYLKDLAVRIFEMEISDDDDCDDDDDEDDSSGTPDRLSSSSEEESADAPTGSMSSDSDPPPETFNSEASLVRESDACVIGGGAASNPESAVISAWSPTEGGEESSTRATVAPAASAAAPLTMSGSLAPLQEEEGSGESSDGEGPTFEGKGKKRARVQAEPTASGSSSSDGRRSPLKRACFSPPAESSPREDHQAVPEAKGAPGGGAGVTTGTVEHLPASEADFQGGGVGGSSGGRSAGTADKDRVFSSDGTVENKTATTATVSTQV